MAGMAEQTEVRVGYPGSAKVRTIHVSALEGFLGKGFFRVDDSGAPVTPDGLTQYKTDSRGDPIIPPPSAAEVAEAAKIKRPPTDEYLRAQAEAQMSAPAPSPAAPSTSTRKEG